MANDILRIRTTGIDHVVMHVQDLSRSRRFYIDLLGMDVDHENEGQLFLRCGPQQLALFARGRPPEDDESRELNHIALHVETGSYEEVKSALEAAGVAVNGRRNDPECIYFRDPDGHRLQILPPRR